MCRSPEELTAFPRERPPAARMMIVHKKLLKSSLVRIPVPKNKTSGIIAMTPMSPNTFSSWWEKHHNKIVARVVREMNHWTPEILSLAGRMGMMVVPLLGLKETSRRTQIAKIDIMQIGRATKNQLPQLGGGFMFCRAMMFWGLAIGEAIPPMLEASAIPRINAFENWESDGKFRNIGYKKKGIRIFC